MTNPTNKYTEEEFTERVFASRPGVISVSGFSGVDNPVTIHCTHGETTTTGWNAMRKTKYCCRKSYWENKKTTTTLDYARAKEMQARVKVLTIRPNIDISTAKFVISKASKSNTKMVFTGAMCKEHFLVFDLNVFSKTVSNCPVCRYNNRVASIKTHKPHKSITGEAPSSFISKQETDWLDELGVVGRQVYLQDIQYRVDGYCSETNTVYLFHGRFWHGCPDTYDPNFIHPIVKQPMKDLYEKTLLYEQKIRDAGYNLITKWG